MKPLHIQVLHEQRLTVLYFPDRVIEFEGVQVLFHTALDKDWEDYWPISYVEHLRLNFDAEPRK